MLSLSRAMLNELTHKEGERVALNSYRYAWIVMSNIFIYGMATVLFGVHSGTDETDISSADAHIFRTLSFIVIGVGLLCMLVFHVGLKESAQPAEETEQAFTIIINSEWKINTNDMEKIPTRERILPVCFHLDVRKNYSQRYTGEN